MISNEEMYEFASQIAGITDSDLQQYKCGGKAKMKKDCGGAKLQQGNKFKQFQQDYRLKQEQEKQAKKLQEEKKNHPERFDSRGNRKYTKEQDTPTNENQRPTWKPDVKPKRK